MKNIFLLALLIVATSGCANSSGARMGLFSATSPVLAILHDDLFVGEAVGGMDRTGTIDIHSALDPSIKCVGSFRYTGSKTGTATVKCNDGAEASLSFNALSMLSGYGYGNSTRGPASFTYGLTPEEAAERLKLPSGKRLTKGPQGPRLTDI
jgi:heat shock protein HslJ